MTTEQRDPGGTARRPCATCGAPVDPLRAPFVAHIDGAFRYYCGRPCYDARGAAREGGAGTGAARAASTDTPPSVEQVAEMLGLARASLPPEVLAGTAPQASGGKRRSAQTAPGRRRAQLPEPGLAAPLAAAACAALALLLRQPTGLADTARGPLLAVVALAAALLAAREAWRARLEGGQALAWGASLLGPLLLFALAARGHGGPARLADAALLAAAVPVVAFVARARLRRAQWRLGTLGRALPRSARVVRGGQDETVEASSVRAGEEVLVASGEVVPVDGVVRAGGAQVVPFAGGGEARPREAGDSVLAGARVIDGTLQVLATRAGDDVALARLARVVDLGAEMPRSVLLAERAARALPLAVAAVGAGGAAARAFAGGGELLEVVALAFGAAPCALGAVLARVPFADAVARAAGRGIVFRDARSVEAAATVGTVVLCVRGTVTAGRLEVVEVVSLGPRSERELVALAAGAEEVAGDHPIARAFAELAQRRGVQPETVRRPMHLAGRGITAINSAGESVAVGSRQLLLAEGVSVAPAEDVARAIEGQQRTAVFVAIAGRVEGVFGIEDPLRDEARPAVQSMMDAGFDLALLTGESSGTTEAIGLALDVTNLRPEVLPEERAAAVRTIAEVANAVAVVGRPQRDGAALGAADVAISLAAAGAAGGDTAVALASDDLRDASAALTCARAGRARAVRVAAVASGGALVAAALCAFIPALGAAGAFGAALSVTAAAWLASQDRAAPGG